MQDWSQWAQAQQSAERGLWSQLIGRLQQRMIASETSTTPFVEQLRQGHGDEIAAILFYGSCLFSDTQQSSSFPDFYVLVSSLRRYHSSIWHTTLNMCLPPNVYYGSLTRHGQNRPFKCCVISTEQYRRQTSIRAQDIHHLGRFSKQLLLAYSRDEQTTGLVVEGILESMLTLVSHSLTLLPERFSLEQFLLMQLGLSYLGERRVVEPTKVNRLFTASKDFYLSLYPDILSLYASRFGTPSLAGERFYTQLRRTSEQRQRTEAFLRRSRRRGVLRWPKYILTVDNWLQYILDKLERHQGVRVELSARQRKYPLIFGWPVYFELRRKGIVK